MAERLPQSLANEGLRERIEAVIDRIWPNLPTSDAVATREMLMEVAPGLVEGFGEVAATVAADHYDTAMAAAGRTAPTAQLAGMVEQAVIEANIRWSVGPLFGAEPDLVKAQTRTTDSIERMALTQSDETMRLNAKRDNVRFAWVPSGPTCEYCTMLGSRGAVYWSRETAARGRHARCNCSIEPVVDESDLVTLKSQMGYDPERLYAEWKGLELPPAAQPPPMPVVRKMAVDRRRLFKHVQDGQITHWKSFKGDGSVAPMKDTIGYRYRGVAIVTDAQPLLIRELGEATTEAAQRELLYRVKPHLRTLEANLDILHDDIGSAIYNLRQIVVSPSPNPADVIWAAKYNIQNFRSSASAGYQHMTFYGDDMATRLSTLRHEMGHVVDAATNGSSMHITNWGRTEAWSAAQTSDVLRHPTTRLFWNKEVIEGHTPTLNSVTGVTKYGSSSPSEDVAESFRLFLTSRSVGSLTTAGHTFEDLWPARAKLLEGILKKGQRARPPAN